jgi:NAD-dependent dihydropyrimidine dehydrogenase PreA subunit
MISGKIPFYVRIPSYAFVLSGQVLYGIEGAKCVAKVSVWASQLQVFFKLISGCLLWTESLCWGKLPRKFLKNHKSKEEVNFMAHTINDECINCAACADTCPVDAISEQGDVHVIDAATCTDCGACVDSCPVNAIEAP